MGRNARGAWGVLAIAVVKLAQGQPADQIPSIIVSAEKRAARIDDVPISMSALSANELASAGIADADALAERLPTLDLQRNAGLTTTSLRIRRVGNIGNIPTFEPSVGLFVDGAFRSRSFLGASHFFGLDHLEVLRGPQTAMYGKNVSSGVLALYTHEPTDELSVVSELTGGALDSPGRAGLGQAMLDVSGPISSGWRGQIGTRFEQQGHTLRNVLPGAPNGNDARQVSAHGQLSWSSGERLELRLLSGYLRQNDSEGESDVYLAPGAGSTQVSSLLQQLGLTPPCPDNIPRNRKLCSVATNQMDLEAGDVTLLGTYRLANGWALKSITSRDAYRILRIEDDAIQLYAPMLFYHDAERSRSDQEELTLESRDDGVLTWILGSFYFRNLYDRGDHGREPMFGVNGDLAYNPIWPVLLGLPLAQPGQLGLHDSHLDTRYFSVFAQAKWNITAKLRLTAALRWQQEDKDAVIHNSATTPGPSLIASILTPETTLDGKPVNGSLHRRSENVPWSFSPQYRFSDDAMAYLTLAHGSKSGGYNTGFGDAPLAAREFADETIHHYEFGTKTSFANRRVLMDVSAFYTRYDNYQDAAFISAQFSVGNAERVALKGIELEGSALVHRYLTMDYSVSLADLRYVTNTHGLCYPGRMPDGSSPSSCDLSGKHPIQAPRWETHLGMQYEVPRNWGAVFARLDWSWTDDYNTSFSADPRLVQPAYSSISARVGLHMGSSAELTLWSNNLLNSTVSQFDSLLNLFNDPSYQSYLAAPRSYGLTLRWHL